MMEYKFGILSEIIHLLKTREQENNNGSDKNQDKSKIVKFKKNEIKALS